MTRHHQYQYPGSKHVRPGASTTSISARLATPAQITPWHCANRKPEPPAQCDQHTRSTKGSFHSHSCNIFKQRFYSLKQSQRGSISQPVRKRSGPSHSRAALVRNCWNNFYRMLQSALMLFCKPHSAHRHGHLYLYITRMRKMPSTQKNPA